MTNIRSRSARVILTTLLVAGAVVSSHHLASADGNEVLGTPSIPIATGSGVVVAGTGTAVQPADINIDVPGTPKQVLLYWEGQHRLSEGADTTISVNGTSVTGQLIGGPNFFFSLTYSSTYRADVTALGLVAPGANTLTITDMQFPRANGGAGVLVIYDDGSEAEISLFDGNDLAFINFPEPRQTTVAKTFNFAPEPVDRTGDLSMFMSSVEGPDHSGPRPSVIEVTVDGVVTEYNNILASVDGDEWDTVSLPIVVPAGASSITVQVLSADRLGTGNLPASLAWNAASFSISVTPETPGGGEGCTPGFWKNRGLKIGAWTGYAPTDSYKAVFGVNSSFNLDLLGALNQGGGNEKALGRHAVAGLLNASSSGVSYKYTTAQVIALVQSAYTSGDFNGVKDVLEHENELHNNDLCG